MLKNLKKTLAIASVTAFALSLAPAALAAGPAKESRGNSGNAQTVQAQSMKAKGSQGTLREKNQVQNQQQETNQVMQCEREGSPRNGMALGRVSAAIAGLSEEDAQTLSTYIDAYQDAVAAMQAALASAEEDADLSSYREAVQTARQALLDAAEEAGIDLELANCGQPDGKNGKGHGMNPGAVASSIAKLSEENADTLSIYFKAYQTAVADKQAALASAEEGADLSDYREAVQTALQALLDAGEENGIDLELAVCSQVSWRNGNGHGMNPGAVASSIAKLGKEDAETLDTYIDAYQDAVAAKRAALASAEEGTDLSAYCEAVQTALQNLLDAASDAGVALIPVPVLK